MVAKRKQKPGYISDDARLDSALNQLGDVLAEIASSTDASSPATLLDDSVEATKCQGGDPTSSLPQVDKKEKPAAKDGGPVSATELSAWGNSEAIREGGAVESRASEEGMR
jgi:hypothetical protein